MITGTKAWNILARVACGLMLAGSLGAAPLAALPQAVRPGTWHRGSYSGQSWIVVEVMKPKGDVSYEAIQSSSPALQDRIARAQADYLDAVKSWKKDKDQAAADKTKFEEKKPVPGYVKRVPTTPATFSSKDRADAVVQTLTRQMEQRKKTEKTP